MIRTLKILFFIAFAFAGLAGLAQEKTEHKLVVFTDRDFCISGDTVWVKVFVPSALKTKGNIVHFQLESQNGRRVTGEAVKCTGISAEGYIAIPDSLQTGLYFVHAFLNAQRNDQELQCIGRSLYVYNRFEEDIEQLPALDYFTYIQPETNNNLISITNDKPNYNRRDQVHGAINIRNNDFEFVVASARILDPFSDSNTGYINFTMTGLNSSVPAYPENDGLLISGRISDNETGAPANELVLLSVAGNETYFDYYYPDKNGAFHFFLQDAKGIANLVIQPLTDTNKTFSVSLTPNFLSGVHQFSVDTAFVNPLQAEFIRNSLKGTFYNKLFKGVSLNFTEQFQMKSPYGMPFYGQVDDHIIPDRFIDLPNFEEIARELLIGVQYRNRSDETTLRIFDFNNSHYFTNEPLRLINGIPVFKNSILQALRSADIATIDLVKRERVFGDLRFRGVLAVSLNEKSNDWMAEQPNIFQLKTPCIQWPKQPNYKNEDDDAAMPDTRQQFLNEFIDTEGEWPFSFELSDVKGDLEISVEAVTKSGKLYKTSKIISVQ